MKRGFQQNNIDFFIIDENVYKIPFYCVSRIYDQFISDDMNLIEQKEDELIVEFKTPIDFNKVYKLIIIEPSLDINEIDINFETLEKTTWVSHYEDDLIILEKNKKINSFLIFEDKKGIKTPIDFYRINNKIQLNKKYKNVIVSEDNKIYKFNFDNINKKINIYSVEYAYSKGVLFLFVSTQTITNYNREITITGMLDKKSTISAGLNNVTLKFNIIVDFVKELSFFIDTQHFLIEILNKESLPKTLSKTKSGFRLDKISNVALIFKTHKQEIIIPSNTVDIEYKLIDTEIIKLLYKNIELFSYTYFFEKNLPELNIINNPLKIILSGIPISEVEIKFKEYENSIKINSNEFILNILEKGLIELNIEYCYGATPINTNFKFLN